MINWELHQKYQSMLTEERIEKNVSEGYWPNETILDYLDAAVEKHGDKVAIVDKKSRYTYKELGRLVDRCALGLLEQGVKPGDMVAFQLPNWNEWVIIHYALTRVGAISNPLVPIYRGPQVKFMLTLGEANTIFIPFEFRGFNYAQMVQEIWSEVPTLEQVFVLGDEVPQGMKSWEEFINTPWEEKRDVKELEALRPDPNDLAELIFTSGTTGEPKGVLHVHNDLIAANIPWFERLKFTENDVLHMASTFAHQTGFLYGVRLPTMLGIKGVYQDVWNPEEFVELVEREKITMTNGATPFLIDTLKAKNLKDHDISSLRAVGCFGAPIPRAIVKEAMEKVSGVKVLGGWGQTEDALVTLGKPDDPVEKIISTDGSPFPGMEVRVVDGQGEVLPSDTEGNLQCRGPFVFVGYCKRPKFNEASFTEDGWFDTGDLATIDEDGYVSIAGRTKDVVVRGGENIPVVDVEDALHANPKISDAAVVAMPDPRFQEKACAYVILNEDEEEFTFEEMKQYLLEEAQMPKQFLPERLEIVREFPRTPSGKIQKFKLREDIAEKIKGAQQDSDS